MSKVYAVKNCLNKTSIYSINGTNFWQRYFADSFAYTMVMTSNEIWSLMSLTMLLMSLKCHTMNDINDKMIDVLQSYNLFVVDDKKNFKLSSMSSHSQMSSINVKNVYINDMNNYIDSMSCPSSYNERLCNKPDGLLVFMFFKHPHLVRHRE